MRTLAIVATMAAAALSFRTSAASIPTLTLPDGSVIAIAAVTYGTNHVVGSTLARMVAALPAPLESGIRRVAGDRATPRYQQTTPTEELAVWVEKVSPATNESLGGSIRGFLADESGFISGEEEWYSHSGTAHALNFKVFPRRSETLSLVLFHAGSTSEVHRCGSLQFDNPVHDDITEWQPEPLPVVRRSGDVEVTLASVVTGHDSSTHHKSVPGGGKMVSHGTDRKDGRNYTACGVTIRSLGDTNQIWHAAGEEVSDATGNRIKNNSMSWSGEAGNFLFTPSLWPNEPAWRLKLELKRTRGFDVGELLHFRSISLGSSGETNTISISTNLGTLRVTLVELVRRPPNTNNSWSSSELSQFKFQHSPLPEGTHLDMIEAVTDGGIKLETGSWSASNNERTYHLRNVPLEAKTADFTFAIQRSRVVEFTVKPELATPEKSDHP